MRGLLNRKGQSIVEITLMTPLILVALYVPFDFGMAIFTGHITQNAVRDGARIASTTDLMTSDKAGAVANEVFDRLPKMLVSGSTTKKVTVNYYDGGDADCAENVEVIAEGTYNFFLYKLMALIGIPVSDGIEITRATRMRYAHQPAAKGGSGSTAIICTTTTTSGTHGL